MRTFILLSMLFLSERHGSLQTPSASPATAQAAAPSSVVPVARTDDRGVRDTSLNIQFTGTTTSTRLDGIDTALLRPKHFFDGRNWEAAARARRESEGA